MAAGSESCGGCGRRQAGVQAGGQAASVCGRCRRCGGRTKKTRPAWLGGLMVTPSAAACAHRAGPVLRASPNLFLQLSLKLNCTLLPMYLQSRVWLQHGSCAVCQRLARMRGMPLPLRFPGALTLPVWAVSQLPEGRWLACTCARQPTPWLCAANNHMHARTALVAPPPSAVHSRLLAARA